MSRWRLLLLVAGRCPEVSDGDTGALEVRSPPSLVCVACQGYAAVALSELRLGEATDIAGAVATRLQRGEVPELRSAAQLGGQPLDRVAERCGQFARADRPYLKRLAKGGSAAASWESVIKTLCLERLRCHPDNDVFAQEALVDAATGRPGLEEERRLPLPEELPSEEKPEVRLDFASLAPSPREMSEGEAELAALEAMPAYERMLADYKAERFDLLEPAIPKKEGSPPLPPQEEPSAPDGRPKRKARPKSNPRRTSEPDAPFASVAASVAPEAAQAAEAAAEVSAPLAAVSEDPLKPRCPSRRDSYKDLASVRIVVVIFCGRRDRLKILLRYLEPQLRRSGGVVDHVILALWQVSDRDLSYVEKVARDGGEGKEDEPLFEVRDFTEAKWGRAREGADPATNRMVRLYRSLDEADTVYVKIDDDVVYLAPHAVADMVREHRRGRCLFVSANVVNHAIMSALHQDRGAHRGFEPSEKQLRDPSLRLPWRRVSEVNFSPRFKIERYPASKCVVERWDCAALVHESFLERAAENTLCAFDFGWHDFNRAGYREHRYMHISPSIQKEYWAEGARWSTNMFAFTPSDLIGVEWSRVYGKGDDEEEFTGPHAERRDLHSCAVGSALAVHFSYGSQEAGLSANTDLLRRYDKLSKRLAPAAAARVPRRREL